MTEKITERVSERVLERGGTAREDVRSVRASRSGSGRTVKLSDRMVAGPAMTRKMTERM